MREEMSIGREMKQQPLSEGFALAEKLRADPSALAKLRQDLVSQNGPLLSDRLAALSRRWTSLDKDRNLERLTALVDSLAHNGSGEKVSFPRFQKLIEDEVAGFVVTAHPTFCFSEQAQGAAQAYMDVLPAGDAAAAKALAKCDVEQVHPERSPTLHEELESANRALTNMRQALSQLYRVVFERAEALYPKRYRELRPRLATIASWVGFDLDGRTDIDWSLGLLFRYKTAIAGLECCTEALSQFESADVDVAAQLKAIESGFNDLLACFRLGQEALANYQDDELDLRDFNRLTVDNQRKKDEARRAIDEAFDALLGMPLQSETWRDIALVAAEWHSVGLGLSHIHFRLNAAQLHNAMGPEINLVKAPDQSATRRHFLAAISEKLATVEPKSIHYGLLAAERTTAKRVFMMAAQFRKHFDARTRIRMLVAESDTSFTLLAALYYAKLFGVDDYVEISPLFETAVGLERGDRVIAELIDNPHFLDYIRAQGRFCLQLGFSDSGRYIGQPAASLAIERFKLRLVRLWKAKGLGDVQLLFFDTHGESIGRGAHPESLKKRFLYTHPPRVRQALADLARPEKHEVSFQGGEGFLWFLTQDSALATLTDFLEVRFAAYNADDDRLYAEKGWSLDFFLTLVEYQNQLTDHAGYVRLIDSIGRSLLFPTGSRSMRRQGGGVMHQRLERISQIRAIPHNAVLQQLGYMANTISGLGTAIDRAPDKFNLVHAQSERLRTVTEMAYRAFDRSSVATIEAYGQLLDPGYWLDRCEETVNQERRSRLRHLSRTLEGLFDSDNIAAAMRDLRRDASMMTDCIDETCSPGARPGDRIDPDLLKLHQIRLGLIQFIFMKAMEIPRFSSRFEFSLEELLVELLHLEVPDAVAKLREIFPEAGEPDDLEGFGEDASYSGGRTSGYADLHHNILDHLEEAYALTLVVSGLITLKVGAFG